MLKIRTMSLPDIKLVLQWAAEEGWNPGKYDAEAYSAVDPNGFFILELDGRPIASISAVRYSEDFAFIGTYIVAPEYRKQGYGLKVWQHAMDYLKTCNSIGLYAVPAQISNYAKYDFKRAYMNSRWSGMIEHEVAICQQDESLVNYDSTATEKLALYDQSIFKLKLNRVGFFNKLINITGTHCIVSLGEDATVTGFAVARLCYNNDYRIGPLYANNYETAEKLIKELFFRIGEKKTVLLDIPEGNELARKLAERLKFQHFPEIDTLAMYKGSTPNIQNDNVYAITSLEIS